MSQGDVKSPPPYRGIVFDCDSTLSTIEGVDELLQFAAPGLRQEIARSRIEIDQARLLTMRAAEMMDTVGNKQARKEIAMIKVAAPNMLQRVIDFSIQAHGGAGMTDDFGHGFAAANARAMRIFDGPDEVHIPGLHDQHVRIGSGNRRRLVQRHARLVRLDLNDVEQRGRSLTRSHAGEFSLDRLDVPIHLRGSFFESRAFHELHLSGYETSDALPPQSCEDGARLTDV